MNYEQALINLQKMSRTVRGVVDTSASSTKGSVMAVRDGDTARILALRNFEQALKMAWENRYRLFESADDLQGFMENLAREVNREILKDRTLYRGGEDSAIYKYYPVAKLESSARWFYGYLFELMCHDPYDAVEAAAVAEYYINVKLHLFADGCGKCAMVTAAWLLMRGDHTLPVYPDREEYYDFCHTFSHILYDCGTEEDIEDRSRYIRYLRSLFQDSAEGGSSRKELTLIMPDRLYANNVGLVEAQISSILHMRRTESLILDCANMNYISSIGLRLLLRLKKNEVENLMITNVSEGVYETLDISGFTAILSVTRRMREISLEGCEIIGRGRNGTVYRYSPDTVVKVYNEKNRLEDVRREHQLSRLCFVSGLPTAIPLNIVRVEDHIGAMYELLDAHSLTYVLQEEPEKREEMMEKYVALLKDIHGVKLPKVGLADGLSLPDVKGFFFTWVSDLEGVLDSKTLDELRQIIRDEIPDTDTLLHGDLHPGNLMDVGGELIMIDLDQLGFGDPVFDLCNIAASLDIFRALLHDELSGWNDPALRGWVLETVLERYFRDMTEREREMKKKQVMLCAHLRVSRYAIRHAFVAETDRNEELRRLYESVHSYH